MDHPFPLPAESATQPGLRAILFDTETTGFDPLTGDRMIEIAASEMREATVVDSRGMRRAYGPPPVHPSPAALPTRRLR